MNGAVEFEFDASGVPEAIPATKYRKILHKSLAGICGQKVFLPLWAISSSGQGLSLELQILQDATAPVNAGGSAL